MSSSIFVPLWCSLAWQPQTNRTRCVVEFAPSSRAVVRTLQRIQLVEHVVDQRLPGAEEACLATENVLDLHVWRTVTALPRVAPEAHGEQLRVGLWLVQVIFVDHVCLPVDCGG
jgi:hypothetical protein